MILYIMMKKNVLNLKRTLILIDYLYNTYLIRVNIIVILVNELTISININISLIIIQ